MNYKIIIPEESFIRARFNQENIIGLASINKGLCGFEPRVVLQWHLSIILHLNDKSADGQPLPEDSDVIDDFEDVLYDISEGDNPDKPNGLFLAKIMWNGTIEFIWRVVDPEVYNDRLKTILANKQYKIPFDFKITQDAKWTLTEWHMKAACQ